MSFTDEELDLYNEYMNYLRKEFGDIKWSCESKWSIVMNDKDIKVISYENWRIMLLREEKLNKILRDL